MAKDQKSPGGLLVGETDKNGGPGIKVVAPEGNITMGGGEIIINEKSSKKYCEVLSKINSEDGNGVAIPCNIQKSANTTDSKMEVGDVIKKENGGSINGYTSVEVQNAGWRKMKEKLGERKARKYFDQANRLMNPNEHAIVEYRTNAIVAKEGGKYMWYPLIGMDYKNWWLGEKMDISDQFSNGGSVESKIPSESNEDKLDRLKKDLIRLQVSGNGNSHLAKVIKSKIVSLKKQLGISMEVGGKTGKGKFYKEVIDEDGTKWEAYSTSSSGKTNFDIYRNGEKQEYGAYKTTDIDPTIDQMRESEKRLQEFRNEGKSGLSEMERGGDVPKKVIRRNLPINKEYNLIDSFYTGGILENPMSCDNCNKPIANVAVIEDEDGKKFHVGMDCAETLASIKHSMQFNQAAHDFSEAAAIRTKVRNAMKKNPNARLSVENNYLGTISMSVSGVFSGTYPKEFFLKHLPDLAKHISNPEKNQFAPRLHDNYDFDFDFGYFKKEFVDGKMRMPRYDGPKTLNLDGYKAVISYGPKPFTNDKGETHYNDSYEVKVYKGSDLIGERDFYMYKDIPTKIIYIINEYEFNNFQPSSMAFGGITKGEKDVLMKAKDIWIDKKNEAEAELRKNISKEDRRKYNDLLDQANQHIALFEKRSMEKGGTIDEYDDMETKFPAINHTVKKVRNFLVEHKYPIISVSEPNFEQDGEIRMMDNLSVTVTLDDDFYVAYYDGKHLHFSIPTKNLHKLKVDIDKYYSPKDLLDYSPMAHGGKTQLEVGIEVEKEHKDLYERVKKMFEENGKKMPISENEFYKTIAKAHLREDKYYYDKLLKYVEGDKKENGGIMPRPNNWQVYYMDNNRQKKVIKENLFYHQAVKMSQEKNRKGLNADFEPMPKN